MNTPSLPHYTGFFVAQWLQCRVFRFERSQVRSPGGSSTNKPLQSCFGKTNSAKSFPTAEISKASPILAYEKPYAKNLPLQYFIVEDVQGNLKNYEILQGISNADAVIFGTVLRYIKPNSFSKFTVVYLNVQTEQQRHKHLYSSQ